MSKSTLKKVLNNTAQHESEAAYPSSVASPNGRVSLPDVSVRPSRGSVHFMLMNTHVLL
jgi:hypothetical protein